MTGIMINGFKAADWEAAKHEAHAVLIGIAAKKRTITYGDLVQKIKAISVDAHDARLAILLEDISVAENKEGRGLLTVVVVHKEDKTPGEGFFRMAKQQGRKFTDKLKFWSDESNYVHDYWSKRS